jgi:hypothetical protein
LQQAARVTAPGENRLRCATLLMRLRHWQPRCEERTPRVVFGHGPCNPIDALAQPEKRQDCNNDDDCANEVDNAVHHNYLRVR